MKFSVIMPTYNRSAQVTLTLAAFEKQTWPMDDFEVIVVNDGSTDDTLERLRQCHTPYRLVIVTLESTGGRSVARNVGVRAAQGEYLIFCDPDYIVLPRFIEVHAHYLNRHPNTAISGVPYMWKNAYTQVFPDYSAEERVKVTAVLQQAGLWNETFENLDRVIEIVTPDDIRQHTGKLEQVISPFEEASEPVIQQFVRTDVAPWLLCVTRSLSMSREMFDHVGGFYEPFKMYGFEDWELGYRLHRLGYPFVCIGEIIGYHQEHPSAFRNTDVNGDNLRMAFRMHGVHDPELSMFAVCSPSEDILLYKNALKKLVDLQNSPSESDRQWARQLTLACAHVAQLFVDQPDSQEYKLAKAAVKQALIDAINSQPTLTPPAGVRKRKLRKLKRRRLRLRKRRLRGRKLRRLARGSIRRITRSSKRRTARKPARRIIRGTAHIRRK
ncbi:glycosyltransferase family 2 protein [Cohnella yongneupensis]|uniref:Glycosyltransferase family 2 protein n=1 Tax=Cohnella yongneupensis TaxID=425006 RepID=A0ABW0R1M6_9BACL